MCIVYVASKTTGIKGHGHVCSAWRGDPRTPSRTTILCILYCVKYKHLLGSQVPLGPPSDPLTQPGKGTAQQNEILIRENSQDEQE